MSKENGWETVVTAGGDPVIERFPIETGGWLYRTSIWGAAGNRSHVHVVYVPDGGKGPIPAVDLPNPKYTR